jgi:hypothetical protein
MSIETWQAKYPVINDHQLNNLTLREVAALRKEKEPKEYVWSARLSSGLFGLVDCPAGNSPHAPKGENEVMLAIGGSTYLIDLGFLPCPTCHPENTPDFWDKAREAILIDWPFLTNEKQILDRNLIPFDAMRLNWKALAPYLTKMPNRIYTQPNLDEQVVIEFKKKIEDLGFSLPPIGFYDHSSPTRFTEYKIK